MMRPVALETGAWTTACTTPESRNPWAWTKFLLLAPCPQHVLISSLHLIFVALLAIYAVTRLASESFSCTSEWIQQTEWCPYQPNLLGPSCVHRAGDGAPVVCCPMARCVLAPCPCPGACVLPQPSACLDSLRNRCWTPEEAPCNGAFEAPACMVDHDVPVLSLDTVHQHCSLREERPKGHPPLGRWSSQYGNFSCDCAACLGCSGGKDWDLS